MSLFLPLTHFSCFTSPPLLIRRVISFPGGAGRSGGPGKSVCLGGARKLRLGFISALAADWLTVLTKPFLYFKEYKKITKNPQNVI